MPTPTNPKLYQEVKDFIMSRYKKNSAFASGAIVKAYKERGGKYTGDRDTGNLSRWFKEEWVDVNPMLNKKDRDAYPVFRPTIRVNRETPATLQEIPKKRLEEQFKLKQQIQGSKNLPSFLPVKPHIDRKKPVVRGGRVKYALGNPMKYGGMIVRSFPNDPANKPLMETKVEILGSGQNKERPNQSQEMMRAFYRDFPDQQPLPPPPAWFPPPNDPFWLGNAPPLNDI